MRVRFRLLVVALAAVAGCLPAESATAAATSVTVRNFAFEPGLVSIVQGDRVDWRFPGPDFNHSVTSNPPGQAESFDSDPGTPVGSINHPGGNYVFSHTFTQVGRFTYYCTVHPSMTGTVAVRVPGPGTVLGGSRRQDIDRLAIRVRIDEPGTVIVAGNVKVRGRRRAFRLRRVERTVAADDSTRIGLRLRRSSRRRIERALRRGRRATARVRVRAVDRAGNYTIVRRRIRLRP